MQKRVSFAIGVLILILLISSLSYQAGKKAGLMIGIKPGGEKASSAPAASSLTGSKVVQSQWASARGEVVEIKDRILTLTADGDSLAIPIKETAELITLVKGAGGLGSEPKEIKIDDIKVGDEVTVQIEVTAEGQIQGGSVTVLLPPK